MQVARFRPRGERKVVEPLDGDDYSPRRLGRVRVRGRMKGDGGSTVDGDRTRKALLRDKNVTHAIGEGTWGEHDCRRS